MVAVRHGDALRAVGNSRGRGVGHQPTLGAFIGSWLRSAAIASLLLASVNAIGCGYFGYGDPNEADGGSPDGNVLATDGGVDAALDGGVDAGQSPAVVVTTTNDVIDGDVSSVMALARQPGPDGVVSLREALSATNATPNQGAPDTIRFELPGGGPYVIRVGGAGLPVIDEAVRIDATTQPGAGAGAVVALDGSATTAGSGLSFAAGSDGSEVIGLAIANFGGNGITVQGAGQMTFRRNYIGFLTDGVTLRGNGGNGIALIDSPDNRLGGPLGPGGDANVIGGNGASGVHLDGPASTGNVLLGNYLGLDASGDAVAPNVGGVLISRGASANTLGGTSFGERNVISGNTGDGVRILGVGTDGNVVSANFIGVNAVGATPLAFGNGGAGIRIAGGASGNRVGGADLLEGNVIRSNGGAGVAVADLGTEDNAILANLIGGNVGQGIDLGADSGVQANDVLDSDSGPNDLLNFPVMTTASHDGTRVQLNFTLDVPPGNYRVEFFTVIAADATYGDHGEGEVLVHAQEIAHAGVGAQSFGANFAVPAEALITATATRSLGGANFGATSEFSLAATTSF